MYEICKSSINIKINKKTLTNIYISTMKTKLDLFLKYNELTSEEHLELINLLNAEITKE